MTSSAIAINGRFCGQRLSGVQRAARELTARVRTPHRLITAGGIGSPITGHAWEQVVLPARVNGTLLWSPCNVGPVSVKRQILTIHDAAVLDHPEWFSAAFVAIYRAIWRRLIPRIAKIVTVSAFSRKRLAAHFGLAPEAVDVVPNGVSDLFRPADAGAVACIRARFGLGDAPYFVTLGTREPRKNLALVLGAWSRARTSLPRGAMLVLIGKPGAQAVFAADGPRIPRDSAILPLTNVTDDMLPALLTGATALLYPSHYEGFGLPIVEAMACGTPVVTTPLASMPEIAGSAALYVDANAPDQLAKTLIDLVVSKTLAQELGEKGRARATRFSWDQSAAAMDDLFARFM